MSCAFSFHLKENLEKLIWSFLLRLPFPFPFPHAPHGAPGCIFSQGGLVVQRCAFHGEQEAGTSCCAESAPPAMQSGDRIKRRSWRAVDLTALPFCSTAQRKPIFRARIIRFPQLQCSNRADRAVLHKDTREVRRSAAAGKRPNSHRCNVDLKAVPSIYTCRYCNAAMQTVLCGLLLVVFIITRS